MYNKKSGLLLLSSILLLQSLSITCLSTQKIMMPEHPSVYKQEINKKKSNDSTELKNINQNKLEK
ncbi:MAG: hypothetical protein ACRCXT_13885 [Paraclostridium sp.]